MKPLPLTILASEGPMLRAYLGVLRQRGWRPERIVLMVDERDRAHGRPVAPWLPSSLRRSWATKVQDLRMNHWAREFHGRHGHWCRPWLVRLAQRYGLDAGVFDTFIEPPSFARHAGQVDALLVDGLSDRRLAEHLRGLPRPTTLLFTGGGMVPAALLALPELRLIHVHPGVLPHVRGADGLLWSLLLRGSPGATAFYMDAGLDTGAILFGADLPVPPLPESWSGLAPEMAYRLLYAFVDPLLRAVLLGRWLDGLPTLGPGALHELPAQAQGAGEGETYHFMHPRLRRLVFDRLARLDEAAGATVPR